MKKSYVWSLSKSTSFNKKKFLVGEFLTAFTLIELLVVISIVSLLSSVVLSSLQDARIESAEAKRRLQKNQVILALNQYRLDKGFYPESTGYDCLTWEPGETCLSNFSFLNGNATLNAEMKPYISGRIETGLPISSNGEALIYYADETTGVQGGPPGAYLMWGTIGEIKSTECNTTVWDDGDAFYCFYWLGSIK